MGSQSWDFSWNSGVFPQDVPAGPAGAAEDGFFVPPTKGTSPAQVKSLISLEKPGFSSFPHFFGVFFWDL